MAQRASRTARAGFTLLEVLVAVSILGLGLTVILSSQVGIFSSSQRAENLSLATHLVRCRMNETEVELLKDGFPLSDESKDEGPCCEDESDTFFRCSRKVERIELPQPAGMGGLDGGTLPNAIGGGDGGGILSTLGPNGIAANPEALQGLGPLGALAGMGQAPGQTGTSGGLGGLMGGAGGEGLGGMVPMVMGMVYPDLKAMLEASIRKVTITVHWKEGAFERDLEATQFVANPMQGGLDPNAAAGMEALEGVMGGLMGGSSTGTGTSSGTGTTGTSPTGTTP
jgi:general secretion pathway protein I